MPDDGQEKMARTSVSLPQDKRDMLDQIADANGASIAWVIRHAIDEFLENNKNNRKLRIKTVKE
jgi:predicted transcriptional regulator